MSPKNFRKISHAGLEIRHEHGQIFYLKAEVEVETEKKISVEIGIEVGRNWNLNTLETGFGSRKNPGISSRLRSRMLKNCSTSTRHVFSLKIFIKNRRGWYKDQFHQCQFTWGWDHKWDQAFLISQDLLCLSFFSQSIGKVEIKTTFIKANSLKAGITRGIKSYE